MKITITVKSAFTKSPEELAVAADEIMAGKEVFQLLNIPEDYTPGFAAHLAWAWENGVWEMFPARALRAIREADRETVRRIGELFQTIRR